MQKVVWIVLIISTVLAIISLFFIPIESPATKAIFEGLTAVWAVIAFLYGSGLINWLENRERSKEK